MIYQHQYFILDIKRRVVFDENSKELRLTGNAYRLLAFLCEHRSATITAIGDELDRAKDYNEDHIRQYRYKVNTIIGHDVIEYKNGVYSLLGGIKKVEKISLNDRNTDLLQSNTAELGIMAKKVKFSVYPAIVAVVLLLLTFAPWPYAYYSFLRLVITTVAIYYAYYLYTTSKELNLWFWLMAVVAVIFNPFVPIFLYNKTIWGVVDVAVVAIFVGLADELKK